MHWLPYNRTYDLFSLRTEGGQVGPLFFCFHSTVCRISVSPFEQDVLDIHSSLARFDIDDKLLLTYSPPAVRYLLLDRVESISLSVNSFSAPAHVP